MTDCLEAPGAPKGVESHTFNRCLEVDEDEAWIVEGPYDVASQDMGWLFAFTKPPETIE